MSSYLLLYYVWLQHSLMVVRVPHHQAIIIQAAIAVVPVRVVHSAAEVLEAVALLEVGKMLVIKISLSALLLVMFKKWIYYHQFKEKEINILYQIMQLAPFCFIGILITNLFVTVNPLIPLLMLIGFNIIHKRIMQI